MLKGESVPLNGKHHNQAIAVFFFFFFFYVFALRQLSSLGRFAE